MRFAVYNGLRLRVQYVVQLLVKVILVGNRRCDSVRRSHEVWLTFKLRQTSIAPQHAPRVLWLVKRLGRARPVNELLAVSIFETASLGRFWVELILCGSISR